MLPRKRNLEMVQGDTMAFGIKLHVDQEADSIYFSCALNNSGDYLFQKSLGNGIELIESTENEKIYGIRVAPEDTKNADPKSYQYDLQIAMNGDVFTLMTGALTIYGEVTIQE